MSKIVSLTNQKGGVGKTTSSVNLAVSFAVSEVKTLLIDFCLLYTSDAADE